MSREDQKTSAKGPVEQRTTADTEPDQPEVAETEVPPLVDDALAEGISLAADPEDDDATILVPMSGGNIVAEDDAESKAAVQAVPQISLEPGTVLNNMYRVLAPLDQGGMGRVFKGEEIGTGEPVAIKVILPEMTGDKKIGNMFRREARVLRQLHHPAIVRYFAYLAPEAQMNIHALVMGFIEGTKLSDYLKSCGALSETEVIRLFTRLAEGLKKAHEIGVVHRDLSPDNVMLQDGDLGHGVLIDFGISHSTHVRDVTIGNEFAGKLKYVSPEQLGAFGGETDGRSDVYSFALLMIAALMGKAPQMGDTIVEAVQKRQTVPALSMIPPTFQSLLYRMLQPDPTHRLQNMQAVIEGLQSISQSWGLASQSPQQTLPTYPSATGIQMPFGGRGIGLQTPTITTSGLRQATATPANPPDDTKTHAKKADRDKSRLGLMLTLGILALGAVLAGGAMYWWRSNPIDSEWTEVQSDGALPIVAGTPQAFLAARLSAPCTFITDQSGTAQSGAQLLVLAEKNDAFPGLAGSWQGRFGVTPAVNDVVVTPYQCAALSLVKPFLGSARTQLMVTVEQDHLSRTEGIVGTVKGSEGRQDWLAIVTPMGRVFSLTRQLESSIGGVRRFSFRLPSAEPGVYLLLATASKNALVRAGAMDEGSEATVILPLIGRELLKDTDGYAALTALTVTP